MKKKPPHPPDPRRRHLSKEDEAIWESTAETLKPLKRAKARVHHVPDVAPRERATEAARHRAPEAEWAAANKMDRPSAIPRSEAKHAPPLNTFDRKAARRLRGGHIEIEARVDLHGMRQSEAHAALQRFLMSSYARGLRWVLVITGKGGPRRRDDDEDVPRFGTEERGVLKRNVPMWLAEPELRAIIVSYTEAAIQHGGAGALYVQLRNPEKGKGRY